MTLMSSLWVKQLLLALLLVPSVSAFAPLLGWRRRTSSSWLPMAKIGIYYGTSTGSTMEVAELIAAEFGDEATEPVEIDGIAGSLSQEFQKHEALVVGTPTWNTDADTERSGTGWDEVYYGEMQELKDVVAGKKVAVFGLGDSVSYSANYADASGELHDVFENLGCQMMGYTSQDGYEHETSKAIRGDLFCGLLLDAVNQEDLTEERVKAWVAQLKAEGILEKGATEAPPVAAAAEPVAEPVVAVAQPAAAASSDAAAALIAELEKENARLRQKLEENSSLLDENISVHRSSSNDGFTPHHNPKTGRTMWTSPDGRKCYYTVGAAPKPKVIMSSTLLP